MPPTAYRWSSSITPATPDPVDLETPVVAPGQTLELEYYGSRLTGPEPTMVQIYCGIPAGTLYPIGTQLAETIPSPHPHQTHLRLYPGERLLFTFNPAVLGQQHYAWVLGRLLPPGP